MKKDQGQCDTYVGAEVRFALLRVKRWTRGGEDELLYRRSRTAFSPTSTDICHILTFCSTRLTDRASVSMTGIPARQQDIIQ